MKRRWLCAVLAVCMVFSLLPGLSLQSSAYEEMHVTQELVDFVKKLEGFAKYPFWDYSQYTVGYGSECPDDKYQEYLKNGIPEEDAEMLLRQDMDAFEKEVNDYAKKYKLTFKQHEFDALVSLSFNCGGNWKWETYGILNHAVRTGATGSDLIYAMSLYSKYYKDYVLIKRRLCEANMYLNGVYKAYNKDKDAIPDNYKYVFLDGNGGTVTYAIHGYDSNDVIGIHATFDQIPTGVDANGNVFIYEFAGWYTASNGGTLVEKLDGSLSNRTVLYAQWKDPDGNIVALPKGEPVDNLTVTLQEQKDIWSGPGTYYKDLGNVKKGSKVVITEVYSNNGTLYGKFDSGWISLTYTDYETVVEALRPDPVWPRNGTVTGDNVNVRSGPGTSNPMQYQLNKGDRVVISETYDDGSLLWGKLEDGNWICLTYVKFDPVEGEDTPAPTLTGITLLQPPTQTKYVQMQDDVKIEGSVLQLQYSDGSLGAMTLTKKMLSGFSNATLGENTVKVTYEGFSTQFTVQIVKATVTFLNYDGTLLSQAQYAYGDTVTQPETPTKPSDEAGDYTFVGWTPELTTCHGDATYTAQFELVVPVEPTYLPGDVNGNEVVDEEDAIYLLRHVFFPEDYPVEIPADFDGNGIVDEEDAIYLLRYTFFPEDYPLTSSDT